MAFGGFWPLAALAFGDFCLVRLLALVAFGFSWLCLLRLLAFGCF